MQPVRRSARHAEAYESLVRLFGAHKIKEEQPIKIGGHTLFLDLYLPHLALALEIQGAQHYTFNSYMHADRAAFRKQRENDTLKNQWCEEHGVRLLTVGLRDKVNPAALLGLIKGGSDE